MTAVLVHGLSTGCPQLWADLIRLADGQGRLDIPTELSTGVENRSGVGEMPVSRARAGAGPSTPVHRLRAGERVDTGVDGPVDNSRAGWNPCRGPAGEGQRGCCLIRLVSSVTWL